MTSPINFDPATHVYRDQQGIQSLSVTQYLGLCGLCDFSFVEEEIRQRAMDRGTSVHWMLQLDDERCLNYRTVPAALRPFRKAYRAWMTASGFMPFWVEHRFISPFGFAGTIDRFGYFPPTELFPYGSSGVVDLKSGTGSVQEWVKYQLSPYAVATHPKMAVARLRRRIGLALHPDGTYSVREFPTQTFDVDFSTFMEGKRRVDRDSTARAGN